MYLRRWPAAKDEEAAMESVRQSSVSPLYAPPRGPLLHCRALPLRGLSEPSFSEIVWSFREN